MPPTPSCSGSAVYMRISKQPESGATFLENSIARLLFGPQGAGASWAYSQAAEGETDDECQDRYTHDCPFLSYFMLE